MRTYVHMYVRMCGAHLFLNDGSQVQLLLGPQHEVLSHHHANKHGRHGQQAVWPEGLDDQQLVESLAKRSCTEEQTEANTQQ